MKFLEWLWRLKNENRFVMLANIHLLFCLALLSLNCSISSDAVIEILLNKSVNELQQWIHGKILITRWQKWKQIVTTMKFLSCHQWMISFFDWNTNEDRNKSQSIFILCNWYQIPMLRKKHNYHGIKRIPKNYNNNMVQRLLI